MLKAGTSVSDVQLSLRYYYTCDTLGCIAETVLVAIRILAYIYCIAQTVLVAIQIIASMRQTNLIAQLLQTTDLKRYGASLRQFWFQYILLHVCVEQVPHLQRYGVLLREFWLQYILRCI